MSTYGVTTKGNGDAFISEERHTTLSTGGGMPGQGYPTAMVPYTMKIRSGCEGGGKGPLVQEDKSATLATNNDQYLFQPIIDQHILDDQGGQQISVRTDGKSPTLRAEMHGNIPAVLEAKTYDRQEFGVYAETGKAPTLRANEYKDPTSLVAYSLDEKMGQTYVWEEQVHTLSARDYKAPKTVAYGVDCRNLTETPGLYPTIQAKPNGGQSPNFSHAARVQYIVRRLTPTECARLQGFPDRHGDIDEKDHLTPEEFRFWHEVRNTHALINGKKVQDYTEAQILTWYNKLHTDSAEYKMWGNGIALPPALYCMQGIVDAMAKEEDDSWLL